MGTMRIVRRGYEILIDEGILPLWRQGSVFVWENTIRKYLPQSGYVLKNGIKVEEALSS